MLASNLCVHPDTLLLTRGGEFPIGSLENQDVEVWNGEEWSKTVVVKTSTDQKMMYVEVLKSVGDGKEYLEELVVTEYHKWYDVNGEEVRTHELFEGMGLEVWTDPEGNKVTSRILSVSGSRNSDTFCLTEPKRNKAVFNGILTGNCSEITLFSDEEKAVFRTAFEINPYDHLKMVSARQEYICQSQSTNLFLANTSAKDMSKIYLYALLDKNIKSLYYNYGIRDANIQTNSVCSACE